MATSRKLNKNQIDSLLAEAIQCFEKQSFKPEVQKFQKAFKDETIVFKGDFWEKMNRLKKACTSMQDAEDELNLVSQQIKEEIKNASLTNNGYYRSCSDNDYLKKHYEQTLESLTERRHKDFIKGFSGYGTSGIRLEQVTMDLLSRKLTFLNMDEPDMSSKELVENLVNYLDELFMNHLKSFDEKFGIVSLT